MATETPALTLKGVDKTFGRVRPFQALKNLSFSVPRGAICGLIGPNGAGKTTTFSVVSGFLPTDNGRVDILGDGPFEPMAFKGRVGILPQDADIGLRHTPQEFLDHLARLQGLNARDAARNAEELLERLNLGDRRSAPLQSLSHGMRRRVAVASALLGTPELVLLDEPMSGLDPVQVKSLRQFLASLRGERTLIISSHNLAELELICDYVVILERGQCIQEGPTSVVTGKSQVVEWTLGVDAFDPSELNQTLPTHEFLFNRGVLTQRAASSADLDASSVQIAQVLSGLGIPIREVRRGKSLERAVLGDGDGGDA